MQSQQEVLLSHTLARRATALRSWLCVGLDPVLDRLPGDVPRTAVGVASFCRAIIDATAGSALAFKINFAFFEALGSDGWRALAEVRASIPSDVPVIADAKRGDIGDTAEAYAHAILDVLDFHAVTVNPYLGADAMSPFLARSGTVAFVLCKTSNPGAGALQNLEVAGQPLYQHVARLFQSLASAAEVGLVAGATHPEDLRAIRALNDDTLLLVPGVGAQGASVQEAMGNGANAEGKNCLVAVSRSILYASSGTDYARQAGDTAAALARQTWLAET